MYKLGYMIRIKKSLLKREEKLDLAVNPFWWRLEFQLRTKAIGEEMVQDIMNRLDNFGFYKLEHIRVEQRAFTIIFLNNPELLSLAFPNLKSDSIKRKTRVRKLLRERNEPICGRIKRVLIQNLPKLNAELQLLVGEFLNLENK